LTLHSELELLGEEFDILMLIDAIVSSLADCVRLYMITQSKE
jgi:hypothetical protein